MMSVRTAACRRSTLPTTRSRLIHRKRVCHFSYRFQSIHSKGALLVLFWDILIGMAQNVMVYSASDVQDAYNAFVLTLIVWLTLPFAFLVAGFVGDASISRYNIIYVGSWLSLVCMISLYLVIVFELPLLLAYIVYAVLLATLASVRVNLLPFNIDQLIGSSSDELSAVIHWHNIGPIFALVSSQIIGLKIDNVPRIYYIVVCVSCVAVLLISHSFCKHWLDCTPVNTTNPVKLIAQVLCYARKHKYPENHSAFTYWVEKAPSRLGLGKEIYGGPFSEEAVEGIKTILRLLLLIIICGIPTSFVEEYVLGVGANNYGCDSGLVYEISFTGAYLALIFLYQFFLFPCCHKYIPSMLRRIGLGLLVIVVINVTPGADLGGVFSKQYKLRGENMINIHRIVEDRVIRDIEQEAEEEERRRRRNQKDISSCLHTMSNLESSEFIASY
uniref:Major facilitator superfamily associated domain-containing protein n=1 Tax=Amphimedon queenslandica TaxID=400682 RepID=A0A1X7UST2_AMPQE